jgi:crossover junction endodeoxyribonuclease RusA
VIVEFTCYGKPATKGSTRSFVHRRTGRVVTMADAKGLGAWSAVVRTEAQAHAGELVEGPVGINLTFGLTRPKSVSVRQRPWPTAKPDLDKLVRAVKDSLTGVLWRDDAQVVRVFAEKHYTDGPSYVRVRLWPIPVAEVVR